MKQFSLSCRSVAPALALVLFFTLSTPTSAFFWNKADTNPYVADFSKNGLVGTIIAFEPEDFTVKTDNKAVLNSITILTLPDPGAGTLVIGGQPVQAGAQIDRTALGGLRFQASQNPSASSTSFTFSPSFSSAQDSRQTTVTLHLLTEKNQPPIARNMDLSTYKDIAITSYFDAVDTEGDTLTFQLTSTPARGAVTLAQDGSSQFVYTPYEGKTGNDSFAYVAVDPAGNSSSEAKITISIEKAITKVTYADLNASPYHKAAIRLAEKGIYVGASMDGQYFFDADATVSRSEFLTMAMASAGLEPMQSVALTGFSDDGAIPTWAKGAVSAALKAGVIQGSHNASGAPVFGADAPITRAEATVMLNKLLHVTDVPTEVFFPGGQAHWASQAAANLTACGVLRSDATNTVALSDNLTRGEVAELLDGVLDVLSARSSGSWLPWS